MDFELAERGSEESQRPEESGALGRADWLAAAQELLVSRGVDAVRITRMAEQLGVTRGSFYWHFKNRDELLDGLLGLWEAKNTRAVIEAAEDALDLTTGILGLFDVWIDVRRFDPRLDSALRDWARKSAKVRQAVEAADAARVSAVAALFARNGYGADEAVVRARIIYFSQVGYYALDLQETLLQRFKYLEAYFEGFTGRSLGPKIARAYRAKHLRAAKRR
jgi:AcrR family transcriptional regulator